MSPMWPKARRSSCNRLCQDSRPPSHDAYHQARLARLNIDRDVYCSGHKSVIGSISYWSCIISVPRAGNRQHGGKPVSIRSRTASRLSQEAQSMKRRRPGPSTGKLTKVEPRHFRRPIGPPGRIIPKKSPQVAVMVLLLSRHDRVCLV